MFYVIDASIYVFRAWYSIPDDMQDGDGNPVNALYGFTRFLGDFLEHTRPEHVAVAFDNNILAGIATGLASAGDRLSC